MGRLPGVSDALYDKTATVRSAEGIVTAIPLKLEKGPQEPFLAYSQEDFLARTTPHGVIEYGMDTNYLGIYKYLAVIKPILITPVKCHGNKFGGIQLTSTAPVKKTVTTGSGDDAVTTQLEELDNQINNIDDVDSFGSNDGDFSENAFGAFFGSTPGGWHHNTSISVITDEIGLPQNAFRIEIYDTYNNITSLVGSKICSFDQKAKDGYGDSIFIESVFEDDNYLQWKSGPKVAEMNLTGNFLKPFAIVKNPLGNSQLGSCSASDVVAAFNALSDMKKYKFQYATEGDYVNMTDEESIKQSLLELAKLRNDTFFATLGVPRNKFTGTNPTQVICDYADSASNNTLNVNTYNGELIPQWLKARDPFNDRNVWIPASIAVCANSALKATQNGYAESSAGSTEGILTGYTDVLYSFDKTQANILCEHRMNPVIADSEDGIYVADDQTLYAVESALSNKTVVTNVNIKIRPALQSLCKPYVKKKNNATTRKLIYLNANKYGSDCLDNEEVYAYLVKCDEENNTAAVVRSRNLYLDFACSPTLPINWITVRVTLTPYGEAISSFI